MHPDKQKFILQIIIADLAFSLPFLWIASELGAPLLTHLSIIGFLGVVSLIPVVKQMTGGNEWKGLLMAVLLNIGLIITALGMVMSDGGVIVLLLLSILFLGLIEICEYIKDRSPYYRHS